MKINRSEGGSENNSGKPSMAAPIAALDEAVVALLQTTGCSAYAKFGPRIAPLAAISGSCRYADTLRAEEICKIDDVLLLSRDDLIKILQFKLAPANRLLGAIAALRLQGSPAAAAVAPAMVPAPIMALPVPLQAEAAHDKYAVVPPVVRVPVVDVALTPGFGSPEVRTVAASTVTPTGSAPPATMSSLMSSLVAEPAKPLEPGPRNRPDRAAGLAPRTLGFGSVIKQSERLELERAFNAAVDEKRAEPGSAKAAAAVEEALAVMETLLGPASTCAPLAVPDGHSGRHPATCGAIRSSR